jgi:hypothetical protein
VFRRSVYFSDGGDPMLVVAGRKVEVSPAGFRLCAEAPGAALGVGPCSRLEFDGRAWRLDGRALEPDAHALSGAPARRPDLPRIAVAEPFDDLWDGTVAVAAAPVAPEVPPAHAFDPADPEGRRLRDRARLLADASPEGPATAQELACLIGTGPGSTPTGDDFVAGWLAGIDRQGRGGLPAHRTLAGLLGRTCRLSRHFLHHALAGRFHAALVRLSDLPGLPEPRHPGVQALIALGDRSGRAALAGYLTGLAQGA